MAVCPEFPDLDRNDPDVQAASVAALQQAISDTKKRSPELGMFCRWHSLAFRPFVPLPSYAGNIRQVRSKCPCLDTSVRVGEHEGSPAPKVKAHTKEACQKTRQLIAPLERDWPSLASQERLARLANALSYAVGRFIQIHPFCNGNGRMSRMLWAALLERYGVSYQASIVKRPGPPYAAVMATAMTGDFAPLMAVVLRGLATAAPVAPTR